MGKEKAEGRGGFSMQNMNACLHVHRAWVAWAMPAYSVQMHAVRSSLTWPCMHHMRTAHSSLVSMHAPHLHPHIHLPPFTWPCMRHMRTARRAH